MVREVENPRAPAAIASLTMVAIASISSEVAGSLRAPRSPITYARTAPCGICAATSSIFGALSTASRYSLKVSHSQRIPSLSAAPGISSTPSMSPISQSWRSGDTGAKPTPQFPMTTEVTPCQHVGVSSGSHVTCPSKCV